MKTINMKTLKNASRRFGYNSLAGFILGMTVGVGSALGNPTDPTVIAGSASFGSTGSVLEIQNSPGTIIDWRDFSIDQDEITRFVQESSNSAILNRVTGGNLSQILGQLQSNGRVFLINPNGLVIGENAEIDTAGFVASTLDIDNQDFRDQNFSFNGSGGSIENRGLIHVRGNGELALIASSIENSGVLRSDSGCLLYTSPSPRDS